MRCGCGCSNTQEVRQKAVAVFTGFVMAARPPVPAVSKWGKCGFTARWFWLPSAMHGLLQKGFEILYGQKSQKLDGAVQDLGEELAALTNGSNRTRV